MYCSLNDSVPITDPRRRSPWSVILIPTSLNIFCAACIIRLLSFIMSIVFTGLGQYPNSGPLACRYSYHFFTPAKDPTAEVSSAYHICFTSSFAVSLLNACISGRVDRAYIAIATLPLASHPLLPACGHHFPDRACRVCCNCCVGMCTWGTQSFDVF